jgi:hypothetical protein
MPGTVRFALLLLLVSAAVLLVIGFSQENISAFLDSLAKSGVIDWLGLFIAAVWLMLSFWLQAAVAMFSKPFNYAVIAIFSLVLLVMGGIFCLPFDMARQFIWLNHQTQTAWLIMASIHLFLTIDCFYLAFKEPETETQQSATG